MPNTPHNPATPAASDWDEVLYQNERTQIYRRHFGGVAGVAGSGAVGDIRSIICKRPLGPKAAIRLQHERRILERLAGVPGMQQLATTATPPPGVIALEDRQLRSLTDAFPDKPLPLTEWINLALPLADLIATLHRAGVVHKDLSPANIVFGGAEQTPSLIDFDLATTFAEERPGFIQPQDIAGTLAYMSPEQTGRTGRPVDHRTDLYALGAILYELVLGHPPFDNNYSDPLHLIHDILAKVPVAPFDLDLRIPPALSDILLRLLEKEPDRRYQSAEGLKADLVQLRDRLAAGDNLGDNARFPLGTHDYPLRLLPPSQLIGRATEIAILQAAFDSTLQGKSRGVMVTGAPGAGKSALINELRPIVTTRRGWFVAGKFDQFRQDVSVDAVGQALRGLIRLMLAESETELALLRQRVLQELGSNAGLMAALLPEFAQSFGLTPEVMSGDPIQTAKRMTQASLDLVRAIASPQRPVVIVIDDLQWASASALDFIDAVMTDDHLHGVLLVASYRDNEVDATHPLSAMLARWERLKVAPASLHLNNLPPDDVATLIAAMLRLPADKAIKLGQAVGARTHGNPFDTVELINALRQDGALTLGEAGWQWDATTLRRYVGKGEVIDLLAARIARLSVAGRLLLESMACLGNDVSLDLLAVASSLSDHELETQLESALDDGLLVLESTSNTLRFRHDRVQQAAYGSLDPELRNVLHLAIARRLAAHDDFKPMAAAQYLAAVEAVDSAEERERVVALFHQAAIHARQASNYVVAEKFITAALKLLDRMQTSTANEIAPLFASLQTELHLALYCLGRLDEADEVYRALEKQCTDPLKLADAACNQMCSLTNRGQSKEASALGLGLLEQFGLKPPQDIGAEMAGWIDELSRWVFAADREEDLTRTEASDPLVLAAGKLIDNLQLPVFSSNPMTFPWLVLQSQRLWVSDGPCAALMGSVSSIPILLIAMRQDYAAANRSAKHLRTVGETRNYGSVVSIARSSFSSSVQHWFEPLDTCIDEAQRAREGLLRVGNFQFACLGYNTSISATFDYAQTLDACSAEVESGLAFAARTGNEYTAASFLSYRQLLRALRGETRETGSFSDDDFDEVTHLAGMSANQMAVTYFHINRAISAALFGDAPTLARLVVSAIPLLAKLPGYYSTASVYLLRSFSLCEQLKTATPDTRAGLLAELDVCREWLSARAADAPMNFLHLVKWVDAERAWAIVDVMGAMTAFDAALAEVALQQRPWHHALMTERAGLCHLAHGLVHSGQTLLGEARDLYDAWGASAKVAHLLRQHSFLRTASVVTQPGRGSHVVRSSQGSHLSSHHSGTTSISATSLDLLSILRASQALSSETNLAGLRLRIETLLRELTGATHLRGAMWYEDRQEWCMAVPGEKHLVAVEAASQRGLLPLSVFHYVVRTREPLLVNDARRDDRFANDPYFNDIPCCSLLGVPIFNHGVLRTVFLLENRLSHGAFTADRLDAMLLIAGQLAISIDNALLYDSLERKVAERTQALEEANQRLAALSITDALTNLANRRRFDEVFASEWQRAIRPQTSLAVAMIDIDQFKLYNDHYGHQGGDECLRKVAAALQDTVRGEADLVARYGGEEFVIVLPGADLDAMQVVAERARAAVEALHEPHEKAGHGIVTISLGISTLIPTAEAHPESLIELADAALYRAKKNGRNQVVGSRPG